MKKNVFLFQVTNISKETSGPEQEVTEWNGSLKRILGISEWDVWRQGDLF